MSRFNTTKHGYDTNEVDQYVDQLVLKYEDKLAEQRGRVVELKNELASTKKQLNEYVGKDKQISQTLMAAVEKAEEIEENAHKIYELELRRINILYSAWKDVVDELEGMKFIRDNEYLREMLSIFHNNLNKALSIKSGEAALAKSDYIKSILANMRNLITEKDEKVPEVKYDETEEVVRENVREKSRLSNINAHLNNFIRRTDGKSGELYKTGSAYEKNFIKKPAEQPQQGAFDLNEILHPKEDLEEIMKAFDFANTKRDK